MLVVYVKQLLRNYKKIISACLEFLGAVSVIYELLNVFLKDVIKNVEFNGWGLLFLIIVAIIFSIICNFPKLKRTFIIKNRDISITIVVSNIFKQKGTIVIPTNTTFDTNMEDDFISPFSIQGQFQKKYFNNNIGTLDKLISDSLNDINIKEKLNDERKTKKNRYECGTVACIKWDSKKFDLLALADVSRNGTPQAEYKDIIKSLQGLWSFLSENKHIEELIVPVIGTGKAGIVNATRMQVLKEIIFSFVTLSQETKITNNLIICIYPNDIRNNKIDIDKIFEYVDYVSKYRYDQMRNNTDGKPLE